MHGSELLFLFLPDLPGFAGLVAWVMIIGSAARYRKCFLAVVFHFEDWTSIDVLNLLVRYPRHRVLLS